MKKIESEMEENIRAEYDLKSLRVRKLGAGRKSFGGSTVRLEPDVAEIFSSAEAVNEALRFLIKIIQQNQLPRFTAEPNTILEETKDKL